MIEAELSPEGKRALAEKEAQFKRVAQAVQNRQEPNRRASIQLYSWIIDDYDKEGGLHGGWAPLAPSTVRRKAKAGKEKMLVWSGRLRNSFRSFYDNDVAGTGSDVTYSDFHEDGTSRIPQRKMLPERDIALDIGIKVYDYWIERAIQGGVT